MADEGAKPQQAGFDQGRQPSRRPSPSGRAGQGDPDRSVELLGPERSEIGFDQAPTPVAAESLLSPRSSRLLVLGGVAVVVLALAVISRPGGGSEEGSETSEIRQVDDAEGDDRSPGADEPGDSEEEAAGDGGADDDDSALAETTEPTLPPPPPQLPSLRSDLPEELVGTLLIAGNDRSLVSVLWEDQTLEAVAFPDPPEDTDGAVAEVQLAGTELIMRTDVGLLQLTEDGLIEQEADISALLPSDTGLTFVVTTPPGQQIVYALPPPEQSADRLEPVSFDADLQLVGRWRERFLVAKAGKLWLLTGAPLDGEPIGDGALVSDGQVLAYDGAHLAMLRCEGPSACRIEIGPPDNPRRTSVPVPDKLLGRDPALWGPTTSISADGRQVAIVDDTGAFSAPLLIDMQTGETSVGSDIINGDSPLAWSPDGRFLTYAFGDDLVLRDLTGDRIYRIDIDRAIDHLVWTVEDPGV